MCDATRIRMLADKVERELQARTAANSGVPVPHHDSAAFSILSRAPLSSPSRDHGASLTPWRTAAWARLPATPRSGARAAKVFAARPPWRSTGRTDRQSNPGSMTLFSQAGWKMDDYSRADDLNRTWKMTDRRKVRSGPFHGCASEDSLTQVFTRPQSQVRSARPQLTGGSLAVGAKSWPAPGYKLPSLPSSARGPRGL